MATLLAMLSGVALAEEGEEGEDEGEKPAVVLLDAVDVAGATARLRGEVDPGGLLTTYTFNYGTTTTYGLNSPSVKLGAGKEWRQVTGVVVGLEPATTYHYQIVATNAEGTATSEDRTFTTPAEAVNKEPNTPRPAEPPTPDADSAVEGAEPELAEHVAVAPARGDVRVRRPGSSKYVPLAAGSELPVGSVVDARGGGLVLTAALPDGETQTGRFGGGRFLVRQAANGRVDLHLRGSYCPGRTARRAQGAAAAGAARRRRGRRGSRRLWGRDKGGRFRTHGKNSHATVRGTRWVVVDRCDATVTRVTEGSVVVRDKIRRKRVVVRVGEQYRARSRR